MLPADLAYVSDGRRIESDVGNIPTDATLLDIGEKAAAAYADVIKSYKTVFVNGPMGVFEQPETEFGTRTVWDALG